MLSLTSRFPRRKLLQYGMVQNAPSIEHFYLDIILIEMDLPNQGWKIPCGEIRKIQSVSGFVGTPRSTKPQPISTEEAKVLLQKMGTIKAERRLHSKQDFQVGEEVQITDGPFESFKGIVEVVNQEKGQTPGNGRYFGRSTPVEVGFSQVIRA